MTVYSDLLKHPNWQRKRLDILNRDNFTCKSCGSTETTLHVHHFKYSKGNQPWEYPDSNFITLCEDCHAEEELFMKLESDGFLRLNRSLNYPMCRMWRLVRAFAFLHNSHPDEYKVLIDLLNDSLSSHMDEWDEFIEEVTPQNG